MSNIVQAIRGMNDILPDESYKWLNLEFKLSDCLQKYGYRHIRLPFLESTKLFQRTIGEATDIVEKEMYTFQDLNSESISLRPEGTAGCVRACLQHGLLHNQQQKLWYIGPMFRHEKPQKGRYRQFNQLGVEIFGIPGFGAELELLLIANKIWSMLGIDKHLALQINTLGDLDDRETYRKNLVAYFRDNYSLLDEDSKRRLDKNPMRILDSKNANMRALIANAPKLLDCVKDSSRQYFQDLCASLDQMGIDYTINPCLVRGLDYYGHTVFEWVTDKLGSQATVCAGGRFDKLIDQLGGKDSSAVGFALGIERVLLLMEEVGCEFKSSLPDIYIIVSNQNALVCGLQMAEFIREKHKLDVIVNLGLEKFKNQFKKADKSSAQLALILGEDEIASGTVSVKSLRKAEEQHTIAQKDLSEYLTSFFVGE